MTGAGMELAAWTHRLMRAPLPAPLLTAGGGHILSSHPGEGVLAEIGEDVAGAPDDPAGLGERGAFAVDAVLDLGVVVVVFGSAQGMGLARLEQAPVAPAGTGGLVSVSRPRSTR